MPTVKIVPFPGAPGPAGAQGPRGYQGETGLTGPVGPTGPAGDSAYDVAVSNGFEGTEQEWLDSLGGGGSSADIADFTFTNEAEYDPETFEGGLSVISLHNKDFTILTTRDALTEEQLEEFGNIDADINLTAADDIFIRAEGDDVNISASNDVVINSNDSEFGHTWEFSSDGHFYFPNGTDMLDSSEIVGLPETRQIVATADYLGNTPTNNGNAVLLTLDLDSQWTIDNFANKTSSTITFGDNSTVDLIAVYSADQSGTSAVVFQWDVSRDVVWPVTIDQTSNISSTNTSIILNVPSTTPNDTQTSSWTFSSDGTLELPRSGIIANGRGDIILDADDNVYVGNSDTPNNQVATIGDLEFRIASAEPTEEVFVVNGGTTATQPTFDGAPLFSGTYVKHGPLVFFQIQVDMDNITNFGTGQYYVDLPFDSKYAILLRDGCLHDESTGNEWSISGHVAAGTSRLFLFYTAGTGQDEFFDHNSPITLNALDNFHVSGSYIAA